MILTPSEKMAKEARSALEMMFMPETATVIEQMLNDAEVADTRDIDELVTLMSRAYAAHTIADAKQGQYGGEMHGLPASWFRDMGQRLLRRSVDAVAVIAASSERQQAGALN